MEDLDTLTLHILIRRYITWVVAGSIVLILGFILSDEGWLRYVRYAAGLVGILLAVPSALQVSGLAAELRRRSSGPRQEPGDRQAEPPEDEQGG